MSASTTTSDGDPMSDDDDDDAQYEDAARDSGQPKAAPSAQGAHAYYDLDFLQAAKNAEFVRLTSRFHELIDALQRASKISAIRPDNADEYVPVAERPLEQMAAMWHSLEGRRTLERVVHFLEFQITVIEILNANEENTPADVLQARGDLMHEIKRKVTDTPGGGASEENEAQWALEAQRIRSKQIQELKLQAQDDAQRAETPEALPDLYHEAPPYARELAEELVNRMTWLVELASGDGGDDPDELVTADAILASAAATSEGSTQMMLAVLELRLFVLVIEMRRLGALEFLQKSDGGVEIAREVLEKLDGDDAAREYGLRLQREMVADDDAIEERHWVAAAKRAKDELTDAEFEKLGLRPPDAPRDAAPGEGMGDEVPEEEDDIDAYDPPKADGSGLRDALCATYKPQGMDGEPGDHSTQQTRAFNAHIRPFLRNPREHHAHLPALHNDSWYGGASPHMERVDDNDDERPPRDPNPILAANGYTLAFLQRTAGSPNPWVAFADQEMAFASMDKGSCTYFSPKCKWTEATLEELRAATIDWWYANRPETAHGATTVEKEMQTYEGPANRVFVWRLVVVHLRAIRRTGTSNELIPITSCFAMDSLVDNVAHLLKYRRCIRMSKCLYTNVVFGARTNNSLHAQYRAKLLNVQHAHHHQDEDSGEVGIARRIIRQAHVANYRHFYYRGDTNTPPETPMDPDWVVAYRDAEHHFTNPPMAPIMCAAPPRMGKSALSLLMVSFASKLGAHVEYGVAPNKTIPKRDVEAKLKTLRWHTAMRMPLVHVYSQEQKEDVIRMNERIHKVANGVDDWTFHVRDEAQSLIKSKPALQTTHGTAAQLERHLQNSYPVFYGLTMCVSATLLPVFGVGQVTGSVNSVYALLKNRRDDAVDQNRFRSRRGALMKNVALQPWSFPIAPDFLTPPLTHFPIGEAAADAPGWYNGYYGSLTDGGYQNAARTTHYYGMGYHVREWRTTRTTLEGEEEPQTPHILSNKVLLDRTLHDATLKIDRLRRTLRRYEKKQYSLEAAYTQYLKTFNRLNTRYFDVDQRQWLQSKSTRTVNRPIVSLTRDASYMLEHAQRWLEEDPTDATPTERDLHPNYTLYPMLIMAPVREKGGVNGRLEWIVLLCKLAWLRFQTAYTATPAEIKDTPKEKLKREYGMAVLVYSSSRKGDYVDVVCAEKDFTSGNRADKITAVVFDPTLPENRFPDQVLQEPNGGESSAGTMLRNTLVPFLSESDYDEYVRLLEVARDRKQAAAKDARQFVEEKVALKVYNYEATPTDDHGFYAADKDDYGDDVTEETGDEEEESDSDEETQSDSDDENSDGGKQRRRRRRRRPRRTRRVTKDGKLVTVEEDEDAPSETDADVDGDDDVGGDRSAPVDPGAIPAGDGTGNARVEPKEHRDMNAIALRLCVRVFPDAQRAVQHVYETCNTEKIAAVGYSMFKAGLTLQSTLKTTGGRLDLFVPKYMSFALSTQHKGPDLSYLYQLVGRGFVDMKHLTLPPEWKLQLLSKRGSLELIREYGDAELIASTVHNESLAGRLMTVGGTLWSANKNMADAAGGYATKRLKGNDDDLTLSSVLFQGRGAKNQSFPSTQTRKQLVFGRLRECLAGEHMPTCLGDLTGYEKAREHFDKAFVPGNDEAPVRLKRYEKATDSELLVGRTAHEWYNAEKKLPPPPSCAPEIRASGSAPGYYDISENAWRVLFEAADRPGAFRAAQKRVYRAKMAAWKKQMPQFVYDALDELIDKLAAQLAELNGELNVPPPPIASNDERAQFDHKTSRLRKDRDATQEHVYQCAYTMGEDGLKAMLEYHKGRAEETGEAQAAHAKARAGFYHDALEKLQRVGQEQLQGGKEKVALYDLYAKRQARKRTARIKLGPSDLARLICSKWGYASNLFEWYKTVLLAEERRAFPGGGTRLVPLKAREPEEATDEALDAWTQDVLMSHYGSIARNHVWIRPHLERMRHYILDRIFGNDSADEADWRHWRVKHMKDSGYVEEDKHKVPDIENVVRVVTREARQLGAGAGVDAAREPEKRVDFRPKQAQMLDLLREVVHDAQYKDGAPAYHHASMKAEFLEHFDKFANAWRIIYHGRKPGNGGKPFDTMSYLGKEYVDAQARRDKEIEEWATSSYKPETRPLLTDNRVILIHAITALQRGEVENRGNYWYFMQGVKSLFDEKDIEAAKRLFEDRYGRQL